VSAVDEQPFDEARDANRRTRLANERTMLAWWRSGLTAFAVALATGKIVPELAENATRWPYAVVGAGYALLGVAFVAYGFERERRVERALREGTFERPSGAIIAWMTAAGVLLGLLTTVLVAFDL
jgi:putative membrane protein